MTSRAVRPEYFEELALGPKLPIPIKEWKRYVDDVFSIVPMGKQEELLKYLNSIDPHIKFTVEQPNSEGAIPFLNTLPKPNGNEISVSVYRKPLTQTGTWILNPATPSQQKELW